MHLIYMGAGFVGACSAAVAADSGHKVLAYDIDRKKIARLSSDNPEEIRSALHEEGLAELILQHRDKLKFSCDEQELTAKLEVADAIFMCLPTPERPDGSSDLSYFIKATERLGELLAKRNNGTQSKRVVLINKSTVPIQTVDLSHQLLDAKGVKNYGIASNPEFLVEGQAINDSIHPSRVVVGAENETDLITLRKIYQRFYDASTVAYIEMNPYEAAAAKLLSNTSLFAKLAYTFSVAGRLCEVMPHLNYEQVRKGITSDPRIGRWGFYDSLYAGGSCLIKDAQSLAYQMKEYGGNPDLILQYLQENENQVSRFVERAEEEAGFSYTGKRIALIGLAFKQSTNDTRHSGSLKVLRYLLGAGAAEIMAHDPAAMPECRALFDPEQDEIYQRISYHENEAAAIQGADAVIIGTDWPEFRTLADDILELCRPGTLVMDGRRLLSHRYADLTAAGMTVVAVGSPVMKPV